MGISVTSGPISDTNIKDKLSSYRGNGGGGVVQKSAEPANISISLYDGGGKTRYSFDPRDREEINERDLEGLRDQAKGEILSSMADREIVVRAWESHSWWYNKEEYESGLSRWLEGGEEFEESIFGSIKELRAYTEGNIFTGLRWEFLELGLNGIDPRDFCCYEGEEVGEMLERKDKEWKKLVYPQVLGFRDTPWVRIEDADPPNPRVYVVRMGDGREALVQRRGDVSLKKRDMVWILGTDRELYYEIKGEYNARGVRIR